MKKLIYATVVVIALGVQPAIPAHSATTTLTFVADIWVDNWYALYINGKKVAEDTTPFKTEKSFNADSISFTATYPFTVGIEARDYVENDSGLEYIGKPNQQIGDGGLILQIHEKKSGLFVGGTDSTWKSKVIFSAPLNEECVKSTDPLRDCTYSKIQPPTSWSSKSYNATSWKNATEYSEAAVGVKGGYTEKNWDSRAHLIWSSDLKKDNTILFRKSLSKAQTQPPFQFSIDDVVSEKLLSIDNTCDGKGVPPGIRWSNPPAGVKSFALVMTTTPGPPRSGETVESIHYEWVLFNIPSTVAAIPSGSSAGGTLGKNFQNRFEYAAPCSQGPGLKNYTFTLYAMAREHIDLKDTPSLVAEFEESKIATSSITLSYARKTA